MVVVATGGAGAAATIVPFGVGSNEQHNHKDPILKLDVMSKSRSSTTEFGGCEQMQQSRNKRPNLACHRRHGQQVVGRMLVQRCGRRRWWCGPPMHLQDHPRRRRGGSSCCCGCSCGCGSEGSKALGRRQRYCHKGLNDDDSSAGMRRCLAAPPKAAAAAQPRQQHRPHPAAA